MTVAVTGATGHLGAALIRELLERGRKVRAVVRRHGEALDGLDVEVAHADVLDRPALRRAFEGVETVFHLAARISIDGGHDGLVERVNVEGAENAARAALDAGVKRFVHFSSVHAFNLNAKTSVYDETLPPASPKHPVYDQSKAAGSRVVREVIADGLDAVLVHPGGCIGPFDFMPSRMGAVFIQLFERRLPAMVDGGFHWVDTRDVALAALGAEEKGRTGESYIVAGRYRSTYDIAQLAAEVTGVRAPRLTVPIKLAYIGAPFATAFAHYTKTEPLFTNESLHALEATRSLSSAKAMREIDFRPRPLEQSVEDIYRWFHDRGRIRVARWA